MDDVTFNFVQCRGVSPEPSKRGNHPETGKKPGPKERGNLIEKIN